MLKTTMLAAGTLVVFSVMATSPAFANEQDKMAALAEMRKELAENSTLPDDPAPRSMCAASATEATEGFFNNMIPAEACEALLAPKDVTKSPYYYENKDKQGCDLGLRMPGLPDFGFNGDGFDLCSLAQVVTSDMVDAANQVAREELNSAMNSVKEETGLKDFNLDVDANDVLTGDENFRD